MAIRSEKNAENGIKIDQKTATQNLLKVYLRINSAPVLERDKIRHTNTIVSLMVWYGILGFNVPLDTV